MSSGREYGGGRGRGRNGQGHDDNKKFKAADGSSTSVGRPHTASQSHSRDIQHFETKIGEPHGRQNPEHHIDGKISELTLGDKKNGNGTTTAGSIGRGGIRGRRVINVSDILQTRPADVKSKKGNFGTPVELVTNYFKLETVPDWVLYQYRVDFSEKEERERVLRAWLWQHRERLDAAYIFDGSMFFTSKRLTAGNEPLNLTSIKENGEPVQIELKFVNQLSYGNSVYLQVFNILVRRCLMHLNLHLVNRNYFDPKASIHVPQHQLEIWPGYVTSIRQHEQSILMCCEIAHKVMRTDTALKVLADCTKERGDYRTLFQQSMIGSIVLTDYNNKTYRVDDVDFSLNPLSTFLYKNNETLTYVEYYKRRYQITIKDLRQPLLISRSSARDLRAGMEKQCLLVPELCRMTGLSSRMLENRNLMKALADVTRVPPDSRIERLQVFNRRLQGQDEVAKDLKQWQMKLSKDLIKVTGREFPPETLIGGGQATYSAEIDVDWTRNMRSAPMLKNATFECFVVICPNRLRRDTESFLNVLNKAGMGMRFRIPQPIIMGTNSDSPADMLEAVEMSFARYKPDLIMFAFTTDRADRYSAVKKKCYVDRGVPSQVILGRSLSSKGVMSIATKVAVQINSKIGGAPWSVHIPSENVMVVGYDVCHDKTRKSKSVGAVVASLNNAMSSWFSTVSFHSNGEELSDSLAWDICKAIRKYRTVNNNVLPTRIFIYRDGVGEGQIDHVFNHEVEILKKRLTEIYGGANWKMAYIIVTKRIKTRFFGRGRNPRPGTVVDDVITLPERYDFYLVSQSVRQGTVSPTSYNVISDNLGWGPNHIQRFTYKMTHLYYNCSAAIGVPAPCQYAHKLAFLVSQSLHAEPHPRLDTSLYFL
ncbi:hypothetical protein RUM43_002719 [Polyplax serrata]|uniref:Uncharacterized protein n=1 Tax=Polyplax serrata TaxID=468196 RepID=A0AAN8PMR3_POLSC